MKNLIKEIGLTIRQFSDKYEIPYNTVRQWYNEERTPPIYIKKLLNELIESQEKCKKIEFVTHPHTVYAVRIKTIIPSKGIENEWREYNSDIRECAKKKDFWETQPNCKLAELECYEKVW